MRMLPVLLEVLLVGRHQPGLALDDQQVFRIVLLGRLREVEAAGDDRRLVDQDDLVVGDSVLVVDEDRDARVGNERGRGVLLRFLALVQNDRDLDAPLVGVDQRLGNGRRREAVCLDQDRLLGLAQRIDDRLRAGALRREVDGQPVLGGRRRLAVRCGVEA